VEVLQSDFSRRKQLLLDKYLSWKKTEKIFHSHKKYLDVNILSQRYSQHFSFDVDENQTQIKKITF